MVLKFVRESRIFADNSGLFFKTCNNSLSSGLKREKEEEGNLQTRQTQTMYCGDKFEEEKKLRKRGFIYSSLKTGIAQKFETI